MRERERNENDIQPGNNGDSTVGSSTRLAEARTEGNALLTAGNDAIQRALSTNSMAFIQAVRQSGGQ